MPTLNKLKLHMPRTFDTYVEKCVRPLTLEFDEDIAYEVNASISSTSVYCHDNDDDVCYCVDINVSIIDPRDIFNLKPISHKKSYIERKEIADIIDNINSQLMRLVDSIDAYRSIYTDYDDKKRNLIENISWNTEA